MAASNNTTATALEGARILSSSMVRPSSPRPDEDAGGRLLHLTPWDLNMISVDYIQKGILFRKQRDDEDNYCSIISALRTSFAVALHHFFPLAGRILVTKHDDDTSAQPPSLFISVKCDDTGAEFIHASAPTVSVTDIADSLYVPPVVRSLFPLNGAINYDGQHLPLLAVQATELADGIFVACSLNHSVADGTSFWHFMNSWSEICRTGDSQVLNQPPVLDRWFVESCKPPIRLPFSGEGDFIRRPIYHILEECFFHFPAASVVKLKAKANEEMGTVNHISSLQSLLSRLWISVTRARGLDPQQETSYRLLVGCRTRLTPPLPGAYLGNTVCLGKATTSAGELLERGLGWGAWLLNQSVASFKEERVRQLLEEWPKAPSFAGAANHSSGDMVTGSSPRFDVYGNDFGWGKPVAVRSGCGNKFDGKATVYQGAEKGSMALEVCLSPMALSALLMDEEFMELVSPSMV